MSHPWREPRPSRRAVLRMMSGAAGMALATACGVSTGSGAPVVPKGKVVIPRTGAKLPAGKVTFTWMDSDDLKATYEKPFFDAYQKVHPNITVVYDGYAWAQINEAVPLGIRNGNAPDVFELPQSVLPGQAVSEGWVAPLDDVVPHFERWKAAFPYGSFIDGVNVFGGRTYRWPAYSSRRLSDMIFYNTDLLHRAGYDPSQRPMTWGELRAAAKKLTAQGGGDYYGLIIPGAGTSNLANIVGNLAAMAGAAVIDINWKTGTYAYTDERFQAAIELLLAIKSDGSLFPGSMSLGDADSRARMPQGVAGMIFDGPWDIPKWPEQNPGFKFGIGATPLPDHSKGTPLAVQDTGSNSVWVYAKSPLKEVAGDMFAYLGSLEGQTQMVISSQGNLTSMMPEANARAARTNKLDPLARTANQLGRRWTRSAPLPEVRNPEASKVDLELKSVHPNLGELVQGALTGQVTNLKQALADLESRADAELDRAIRAARAKGAKVSRDDWVFPNWDPTKDYSQSDYKQLQR